VDVPHLGEEGEQPLSPERLETTLVVMQPGTEDDADKEVVSPAGQFTPLAPCNPARWEEPRAGRDVVPIPDGPDQFGEVSEVSGEVDIVVTGDISTGD